MFHLVLMLFPLILTALIIPILLFGLSSILISIFGGTAMAILIKDRTVKLLLFIVFAILSMVGAVFLFPFIAIYTPLPLNYYPIVFNGLFTFIGIFSVVGIIQSRSLRNKYGKIIFLSVFSIMILAVGVLLLLQIL